MILDIIAYRNKVLKCYANPIFTQEKLEVMEQNMTRALIMNPGKKEQFAHTALYHFGTFNDETGKYDLLKEPELIYDVDDILAVLPKEE